MVFGHHHIVKHLNEQCPRVLAELAPGIHIGGLAPAQKSLNLKAELGQRRAFADSEVARRRAIGFTRNCRFVMLIRSRSEIWDGWEIGGLLCFTGRALFHENPSG
jgi:hypothetical protein